MRHETKDVFGEWYTKNRRVIERGLGGFYLLRHQVYVPCGNLHEEIIDNYLMKISGKVLEDYSHGQRKYVIDVFASVEENNRRQPKILCSNRHEMKIGDSFCMPGMENSYLFQLIAIYNSRDAILIGPLQTDNIEA